MPHQKRIQPSLEDMERLLLSAGEYKPNRAGVLHRPVSFRAGRVLRSPFGEYIRNRRLSMENPRGGIGLTQDQVAFGTGLKTRTIKRWEAGYCHPSGSDFNGGTRNNPEGGKAEILRRFLGLPRGEYYELLARSRREYGRKRSRPKGSRIHHFQVRLKLPKSFYERAKQAAQERGLPLSRYLVNVLEGVRSAAVR